MGVCNITIYPLGVSVKGKIFKKKNRQVETSLIEQFIYPKKGPGQLYEKMAEKIVAMGGEIIYGQTVTKLHISDNKIEGVTATDASGKETLYTGAHVLSSMPIKDLLQAIGEENANVLKAISVPTGIQDPIGFYTNQIPTGSTGGATGKSVFRHSCFLHL